MWNSVRIERRKLQTCKVARNQYSAKAARRLAINTVRNQCVISTYARRTINACQAATSQAATGQAATDQAATGLADPNIKTLVFMLHTSRISPTSSGVPAMEDGVPS